MAANVRLEEDVHKTLRILAEQTGETMQALVARAVKAYSDGLFWHASNEAWDALREDPDAWRTELAERAEWDAALLDGLLRDDYPVSDDGKPVAR